VTAEYQDLGPRHPFERCDLRVRVRAPYDAGLAPALDRVGLETVRDNDLFRGRVEARYLAFYSWVTHVVGDCGPVGPEYLVRFTSQKQGISCSESFRVAVGEAVVERHHHDVPARAGKEAVQRDDVADNKFAHRRWARCV